MSNCDLKNFPKKVQDLLKYIQPQGCQSNEVAKLENYFEISLPKTYKDFLLCMGHSAGDFLQGEDCFYRHLFNIQEWAIELLEENEFSESLPEDAFVFCMHQGYSFSFFRLSEGNDPPVYFYCEGQEEDFFIKSHDKFSNFLTKEVELFDKHSTLMIS